ncbi:MAG: hypothetical protein ACJ789_16510 [Thermomicrobiales bacterium]
MQNSAKWTRIAIRSTPFLLIAGLLTWLVAPIAISRAQESDLVGDYAVNIVKDDVPEDVAYGPSVIGQWQIAFKSDGTYTMTRADVGELVSGSFEVDGSEVTLTDEAGLLSCADVSASNDPSADVSKGAYTWKIQGDRLALTPKDDGCNTRTLILGTRELDHFVSCQTPGGSEEIVASPEATPIGSPESDLGILAAKQEASPVASPSNTTAVEKGIDDLLEQLTACWGTGDPARFLPLLTDTYAQSLLNAGQSQDDLLRNLATAMGVPVTYQRAGDVTIIDATHASAIVRTTNGEQEQFIRFRFALVDGKWKLDGPA